MKVKVEICFGTTCYVLGASELAEIEKKLPEDLQNKVEVTASPCLDVCNDRNYGGAPFVRINGNRIIAEADIEKIIAAVREEIKNVP